MGVDVIEVLLSGQPPISLPPLGSDLVFKLWEHRERGVKAMYETWRLVDEGEVEWAVTRGIDFDIPDGKLRDRLRELPVLGIKKTGKVARLGQWVLGTDVLGGDAFLSRSRTASVSRVTRCICSALAVLAETFGHLVVLGLRQGRHSALGMRTPIEYEKLHADKAIVA